jgi:hypothetical protein
MLFDWLVVGGTCGRTRPRPSAGRSTGFAKAKRRSFPCRSPPGPRHDRHLAPSWHPRSRSHRNRALHLRARRCETGLIDAAGIGDDKASPLFRTTYRRTKKLTDGRMRKTLSLRDDASRRAGDPLVCRRKTYLACNNIVATQRLRHPRADGQSPLQKLRDDRRLPRQRRGRRGTCARVRLKWQRPLNADRAIVPVSELQNLPDNRLFVCARS